jgi:hypothetical protein
MTGLVVVLDPAGHPFCVFPPEAEPTAATGADAVGGGTSACP